MSDSDSDSGDLEIELSDGSTLSQEQDSLDHDESSGEEEVSGGEEAADEDILEGENECEAIEIVSIEKRKSMKTLVQQRNSLARQFDENQDDQQLFLQEHALRREENIKAMLDGSLDIHRKPLLPKLLSVQDAAAVLRKPFKSPHPNAPARSDALKRALAARKHFVPWGASGKHFEPPFKFIPQTADEPSEVPAPAVELPPGIEPLILWEPPLGTEGNPVRVDDALTRFLRPHQREGVQFMFECVAGLRNFDGKGCILADDMGLGKTLQGITLLWTLLNNGHELLGGSPMAKRIIICCPTSLVSNWDSECSKWLNGRVRTLPLCESSREDVIATINQFLSPRNPAQLLIVSYETFRLHAERFKAPDACDLLICDEAHRLKNDQTLTNKALDSLACRRRVLLSGTPMQNQLQEFYAMVNFCNPGVLGTPGEFRKYYESPILAGREPDASDSEAALGTERSDKLSEIVNEFILRRTNSLLSAHLPPKVVEVVCCRMTPLQYDLYCHFVQSRSVQNIFATQKSARALSAITSLRKLLNHPKLIYDMVHSSATNAGGRVKAESSVEGFENCGKLFPPGLFDSGGRTGRGAAGASGLPAGWEDLSGKFAVVSRMLAILREQTKDRVVIVSNYTQTLDLFTALCRERNYPVLRLDGSTSISKRQKLVKKFNDPNDNQYVFLLSSKAGGCGLNLIGGNRLILFDMSWNPADDKQAAARVWRDGQRRRVYVYRFMTTGTIEEKVYQRQLSKEGLQAVVDSKTGGSGGSAVMSLEELRDLFSYDPDTLSTTYDHMVATKGLPKKKREDKKDKTKHSKAKNTKSKAKKKKKEELCFESESDLGDDEEEEEEEMMDGEEKDEINVIENSEEEDERGMVNEEEEEEEEEEDRSVQDTENTNTNRQQIQPTSTKKTALLSAALVATNGSIYKEQEGKPKEEDLSSWGHHSDPKTVPDDCMKLSGGDDVTFVFSCQVDGREVPLDPPLVPLGEGKANKNQGAGGVRRPVGIVLGRQNNDNNNPSKSTPPPPIKHDSTPPVGRTSETATNRQRGTKRPSPQDKLTPVTLAQTTPAAKKIVATITAKTTTKRKSNLGVKSATTGQQQQSHRVAILCDSSDDDDFK